MADLPLASTEKGVLVRAMLGEVPYPTEEGFDREKVKVAFKAIRAALNNRLTTPRRFAIPRVKPKVEVLDALTAPGQFRGYTIVGRTLVTKEPVRSRIEGFLQRVKQGDAEFVQHLADALAACEGAVEDPFPVIPPIGGRRIEEGVFGFRRHKTMGLPWVQIPSSVGPLHFFGLTRPTTGYVYGKGHFGEEIRLIQQKLGERADGVFGDSTATAVSNFQRDHDLPVTGEVDTDTWAKLVSTEARAPSIRSAKLIDRCFAVVSYFETGCADPECYSKCADNFDAQGMSFGCIQFNLGQATLQELLTKVLAADRDGMKNCFGGKPAGAPSGPTDFEVLQQMLALPNAQAQKNFMLAKLAGSNAVRWRAEFVEFGKLASCRKSQRAEADKRFHWALGTASEEWGLRSERAALFLFDVRVQNFDIDDKKTARTKIAALPKGLAGDAREIAVMKILAEQLVMQSDGPFKNDVRDRKTGIAQGAVVVHGHTFDLDRDFNINFRKAA